MKTAKRARPKKTEGKTGDIIRDGEVHGTFIGMCRGDAQGRIGSVTATMPLIPAALQLVSGAAQTAAFFVDSCLDADGTLRIHANRVPDPLSSDQQAFCKWLAELDEWVVSASSRCRQVDLNCQQREIIPHADPLFRWGQFGGYAFNVALEYARQVRFGAVWSLFPGEDGARPAEVQRDFEAAMTALGHDGSSDGPWHPHRIPDDMLARRVRLMAARPCRAGGLFRPQQADMNVLMAAINSIQARWQGLTTEKDTKTNALDRKMPTGWIYAESQKTITADMLQKKRKNGQMTNCSQGPSGEWRHNLAEVCEHYPQYRHLIEAAAARI